MNIGLYRYVGMMEGQMEIIFRVWGLGICKVSPPPSNSDYKE